MKAIILAGGYGMRLKPLTDNIAKPLIHVGGRRIVDHIIDKVLLLPEVDEILVVCNERFRADFEAWSSTKNCPAALRILSDGTTSNEDRLGAIGDALFAIDSMANPDDVLIIGGDNFFTFDLRELFAVFAEKGNAIALYDVGTKELAKLYAIVDMEPDGRIRAMVEKPEDPQSSVVSVCIYMYTSTVGSRLEGYKAAGNNMDNTGDFAAWLCTVEPVYGCPLAGHWFDIGEFESLSRAQALVSKTE